MSVIAWDGTFLAADRRAVIGGRIHTTTKIFRVRDCLVAYAGDADAGEEMLAWFAAGENPATFPDGQRDPNNYAGFLIIRPDKTIHKYEKTPYPIKFEDKIFAIGCGADYALAAMYLGYSAERGIEVACYFDNGCGNGVDVFKLGEPA